MYRMCWFMSSCISIYIFIFVHDTYTYTFLKLLVSIHSGRERERETWKVAELLGSDGIPSAQRWLSSTMAAISYVTMYVIIDYS